MNSKKDSKNGDHGEVVVCKDNVNEIGDLEKLAVCR